MTLKRTNGMKKSLSVIHKHPLFSEAVFRLLLSCNQTHPKASILFCCLQCEIFFCLLNGQQNVFWEAKSLEFQLRFGCAFASRSLA